MQDAELGRLAVQRGGRHAESFVIVRQFLAAVHVELGRIAQAGERVARLSQQLDAALQRGRGQACLGPDDRVLQEESRLSARVLLTSRRHLA